MVLGSYDSYGSVYESYRNYEKREVKYWGCYVWKIERNSEIWTGSNSTFGSHTGRHFSKFYCEFRFDSVKYFYTSVQQLYDFVF